MNISTDAKKHLIKSKHLYMITQQTKIERNIHNPMNGICERPQLTSYITVKAS